MRLGVDMGATAIKSGLVDDQERYATNRRRPPVRSGEERRYWKPGSRLPAPNGPRKGGKHRHRSAGAGGPRTGSLWTPPISPYRTHR